MTEAEQRHADFRQAMLDSRVNDRDLQWLMHQQAMRAQALRCAIEARKHDGGSTHVLSLESHVQSYVQFIMTGSPF